MSERDNVAADLIQILKDCGLEVTKHDLLMQKLCSFVSRRDSKVFDHAYKLGKGQDENKNAAQPHKDTSNNP